MCLQSDSDQVFFLNALFAEPPSNMDELRARAAKYIAIKENTEATKRTEAPEFPQD